jgi:hypothetical protein
MTFAKMGLVAAAFSTLIGFSAHDASASPLVPHTLVSDGAGAVHVQYYVRRPVRRVCRTERVRRWVNGRPVWVRVQRCYVRR